MPAVSEPVDTQLELIKALHQPGRYDHAVGQVRHLETHISHLLLTGSYAYKLKKPLNLGFLDFSTLEQRRFYCEEEVRLNRRLAPEDISRWWRSAAVLPPLASTERVRRWTTR